MKEWNPKSVWDELRKALSSWTEDDDEGRKTLDASLLFHLMLTVPLLLAFITLARR